MKAHPDLIGPILSGSVTQTRLPMRSSVARPKRGHAYRLAPSCKVVISAVQPSIVSEDVNLEAEGHRTNTLRAQRWLELWAPGWLLGHPEATPGDVSEHFQKHWANRPCWVVQFSVDRTETPRLLAPAARPKHSELGYVASMAAAMPDEPEAVDERTLERFGLDAHQRHERFVTEEKDTRPLEVQLAEALHHAREAGVDARHQELAIQRKIRSLRRKIEQHAA